MSQDAGQVVLDIAARMEKDFTQRRMPIRPTKQGGMKLLLFKREHAEYEEDVAHFGWMVEHQAVSLLQHKGIAYAVDNQIIKEKYAYIPEKKGIVRYKSSVTQVRPLMK